MQLTHLALALAAVSATAADSYHHYSKTEYKFNSCYDSLAKKATFCNKKDAKTYKCVCKNQPAMGTMATCLKSMDFFTDKVIDLYTKHCEEYVKTAVTKEVLEALYTNATDYIITPDSSFNKTAILYKPITIKKSYVKAMYLTEIERYDNYSKALWYGAGWYAFMGLVMLVLALVNWTYVWFPQASRGFTGPVLRVWRKYVSLPAGFRRNHTHPLLLFGGRIPLGFIPTRFELIIIAIGFIYLLLVCATDIHHIQNDPVWASKEAEISRFVSDRAGVLALFMYPMTVLFAGRNNFLLYLTRWNYSRFNTFHRHMARWFTCLALTHGIGMTYQSLALGKYDSRMARAAVKWGCVAMALFMALCFSMLFLRRKAYELFLLVHIVFAALGIAGTHYHVQEFGWEGFTWSVVGVWAFDRVVRLGRQMLYGVRTAQVTLIAGETLRVLVPKPKYWKHLPGMFAYVNFLRPTVFWQLHPFSCISGSDTHVEFSIKVKGGVTHSLVRYLLQQPNQTASIKVLVEGPYGVLSPTVKPDNVLLIASGNGIPGLYSHALERGQRELAKGTESARRTKLVWIVRHWHALLWMEDVLKLKDLPVEVVIHVTQPGVGYAGDDLVLPSSASHSEGEADKQGDGEEKVKAVQSKLEALKAKFAEFATLHEGRPHLHETVALEIALVSGQLCVVACGHDTMTDDVRDAVVNNLDKSKERVDYFEETQLWA